MTKTAWAACAVLMAALSFGQAANPPTPKVLEAQRRMDFTGSGSYHRIGMLRELANSQRNAAMAKKQKAGPPAQKAPVAKS